MTLSHCLRGLLQWLLGGRPMTPLGFAFIDLVSGKPVFYFADKFGRCWLAEHPWSLFRVPAASQKGASDE